MSEDIVGISSSPEETDDSLDKMRGDAVGSTMYSERFILKILMRLTKLTAEQWTEDFEHDVCVLWDMSAEPDVVKLLMDHDMLSLATYIIFQFNEPRLFEIMVGIVGNMCCVEDVRTALGNKCDTIDVLLDLLSLPDAPTIIQVLRVLQTCTWDVRNQLENSSPRTESAVNVVNSGIQDLVDLKLDSESHESAKNTNEASSHQGVDPPSTKIQTWFEHIKQCNKWLPKIVFILTSSKQDDLLSCTWSFLDTVCYVPFGQSHLSKILADPDLMSGLMESYKEYFEERFNSEESSDMESVRKAACHWVSILYSFTLHEEGIAMLCQYKLDVMNKLFSMLHYCHTCVVMDEELTTFIASSVAVLNSFLLVEPYEVNSLHSGLPSVINLWRQLSEAKSMKMTHGEEAHLEEDVLTALRDYLTSVKKWIESMENDDNIKMLQRIEKQLCKVLNSEGT